MKDDVLRKLAIPFVLVAGTCWAGMIILIRMLSAYGLGAMDKVLVRCVMSSLILFFLMLFTNRGMLKVKIKDLWIFIISAIITVLLFNYSYFRAADGTMMSAALAVVLLYISPAFVMILSRLILKEKITSAKLIALVLIIIGTILVTGIASGKPQVTTAGLLFGIGAAVFYAIISIINPIAIRRGYSAATITFYTYFFAMLGVFVLGIVRAVQAAGGRTEFSQGVPDIAHTFRVMFGNGKSFLICLLFAIISTVLPFILYNTALKYIEPSRAAIICSIEPVVGTLISVFVYNEAMPKLMIPGIVLIMIGVIVCNLKFKKKGAAA